MSGDGNRSTLMMKIVRGGALMMQAMIKVLVVDDVSRVRDALTTLLDTAGDVEVVGTAANGREAVQRTQELHPDVVLMDLEMPEMDGFTSTEMITSAGLASVVVLSIHGDTASRTRAFAAGACAFLEKCGRPEELVQALRAARR